MTTTSPDTPATTVLRLGRSAVVTLGLALLIAAVLAVAFEALMRVDAIGRSLGPESVGSGQPQLDRKLVMLRTMTATGGPLDALFIGSSQVYRAVDPNVLRDIVRARAGRDLRSFNFGLGGMSEAAEAPLARILVGRTHPRVMFVGVSSYGLDEKRDQKFGEYLESSPWYRYHLGHFNLDGWLLEHSYAIRRYQGHLFWTSTDEEMIAIQRRALGGMRPDGHSPFEPGSYRDVDEEAARGLRRFEVSDVHLDALDAIFAMRSPELAVIAIEMPVHDNVVALYPQKDADHAAALAAIGKAAAAHGVPFWTFPDDRVIPPNAWADFVHLNVIGTSIYSRWLGERIGEALAKGEIKLP